MRRTAVALATALWALPALAGGGGTVRGEVRITTVTPAGQRSVKADRGDVVVYIPDFEEKVAPAQPFEMQQVKKAFVPDVLPIPVGSQVSFINSDARLHNVFSRSSAADFDLGTYQAGTKTWLFKEKGLVDVYCNIHEVMAAVILVLPNHAFQKTGADGRFQLNDVPPGKHAVYAWLRNGKVGRSEVVVTAGQPVKVDFDLEQSAAPLEPTHVDKSGNKYRPHKGYD